MWTLWLVLMSGYGQSTHNIAFCHAGCVNITLAIEPFSAFATIQRVVTFFLGFLLFYTFLVECSRAKTPLIRIFTSSQPSALPLFGNISINVARRHLGLTNLNL